jgi:5-methyltetrahydropteroyltriglutamate--homocysteine methyltransferase
VGVRDVEFLRACARGPIKATVPGPFTMAQQVADEHYGDDRALALDLAAAVNAELRDLRAAGADVVQIDEPWLQHRPEQARRYAVEAIDRALEGLDSETVLHTCHGYAAVVHDKPTAYPFLDELAASTVRQVSVEAAQPRLDLSVLRALSGKTIVLGVLDLADAGVESAEQVAGRVRAALEHVEPERLVLAPDCGMKYLSRETAYGKLRALVEGAAMVRAELAGG